MRLLKPLLPRREAAAVANWYALVEDRNSRLHAVSSTRPDKTPDGYVVLEYAERPDQDSYWDAGSRSFVPQPEPVIKDRVEDDFVKDPEVAPIISKLSPEEQDTLKANLAELLGTQRYRYEHEEPEIQEGTAKA